MKKLLLFFAVAMVVMAGCEGTCHMDFVIKNQTNSKILIKINRGEGLLIVPDDEKLVYSRTDLCDYGTGISNGGDYEQQDIMIANAEMIIGEKTVPDAIWMGKYWDFTITSKYNVTYTLTLTDELIESLLSENN